jgi:hypothetical protein
MKLLLLTAFYAALVAVNHLNPGIHRLDWFARHFQGGIPSDLAINTGLTLTNKGLLQ